MKIELEATGLFDSVNGTRCRVWKGKTASGIRITAYIALIGAADGDDSELSKELQSIEAVRQLASFDMRVVT